MAHLRVREVRCRTLLHRLGYGGGAEYTANFYRGCSHGCSYCYAPSLIHDERGWGTFVDAKVNSPEVMERELRDTERSVVFLSSATDPYQAVEARYRLTGRCLKVLLRRDFPVSILTRSPLVLRDLETLRRFSWARVGFSISTVPDRRYEPGVAPLERRVECLRRLSAAGITAWVSLAPVIPRLVAVDLERLMLELKRAGVSAVVPGLLRFAGYPESRAMFEGRVGGDASLLMEGGEGLLEEVKGLIARFGLSRSEEALGWKEQGESSLDAFIGRPEAGRATVVVGPAEGRTQPTAPPVRCLSSGLRTGTRASAWGTASTGVQSCRLGTQS